ncbi:hypothetical protein [Paractinoplanes lichenicola]|uniref:Uncharacterized protein n=1 Tax=Paractinoplanes lichenicola TaxID=2802976 RepID=A0ABS1VYQ3_9ACTN|nr:hypothetical protein [Actinoplanes lichenicola]MBL7259558.1 hypothetical protein [Actinoplanes lichenicola]
MFRSKDGSTLFVSGSSRSIPAGSWTGDERHRALAAQLDRHGLWDHLPAAERAAARADVATGCYPFDFDLLFERITFFADGESLAEGGVERFLASLAPVLTRLGLTVDASTIRIDDTYVVTINGIECTVWTQADWDTREAWATATVRPLATVNQLLEPLTSVRAHTLYTGGNEGLVHFIAPGVVTALRASGLLPAREIPALAKKTDRPVCTNRPVGFRLGA